MDISALNNNLFAKKRIQGMNSLHQITPNFRVGNDESNPFSKDLISSYVGIGIKDGAIQTSAAQLGKMPMQMKQVAIA